MSIIWRKVLRDLWGSKFRTLLVVVSTAMGVFALGFVYGTSGVMTIQMTESHQASLFPHITFYTSLFDYDAIEVVEDQPGVIDVDAERVASFHWKLEEDEDWQDGIIYGRIDFENQHMNLYRQAAGVWPEGRRLAIDRMSSQYYNIALETPVLIEFGQSERTLPVEGIMRHTQAQPPAFGGNATFFATPETIAWLTEQPLGFNRINVRLESYSEEAAEEAGERIQERLEQMGLYVGGYTIADPEVHFGQETIDSILLILQVLGGLSLALSGFLIINMMNATVAQQIWQIGVMKVIGATRGRVVRAYLTMAAIYGLFSLILAVPPGAIASYLLSQVLLNLFNIPVGPLRLIPAAVAIQIVVALIVPLLAALVPILGGARITPHQAISNYGLGAGFGSNWLDRLIGRIRRLPRPLALSLRNTFRRKARITLTLITLVLGGLMFLVVMSVGTSMGNTVEVLIDDFGFDILAVFGRMHRVPRLVEISESIPGVARAEAWDIRVASLELDSGDEIIGQLWAIPPESEMFRPRITSGRALLPEDGQAILLNRKIAADEGIGVGDEVTLTIEGQEVTWTVVGLVVNINNAQQDNFVPFESLERVLGNANRGSLVIIATEAHDVATHRDVIRDLRTAYDNNRLDPLFFQSGGELREQTKAQFDIITYLMMVMAILAAAVGGVGLMSTMSINVAERGREIGVMRAVGARSIAILGIFVTEGVLVGVLSWCIALPLSYPGARLFAKVVGDSVFQMPLDFSYPIGGTLLWLIIVVILSGLASLWPALRATQVSVRETLSYE